jgi:hypothetical protein
MAMDMGMARHGMGYSDLMLNPRIDLLVSAIIRAGGNDEWRKRIINELGVVDRSAVGACLSGIIGVAENKNSRGREQRGEQDRISRVGLKIERVDQRPHRPVLG